MSYQIIPIAEGHLKGFHRALNIVAKERKYLRFTEAPSLMSTRKFIVNNITNDYPQFVVIVNDEVVGWCDIIPEEYQTECHVGVMGCGLLPEFRGRGLGAKLIAKTMKKAEDIGLKRVELTVNADNKNAVGLYQKLGFEIEGIKKKASLIDGKYVDIYMMAFLF